MDIQNIITIVGGILTVAGAILLGLPALLHALVLFFKLIPGDQPDAFIEQKLLPFSEKVAEIVGKLYPKTPAQQ